MHSSSIFPPKCLLLNKTSKLFALKIRFCQKILSKQIWFAILNTDGSTGPLMTSFLPFTDIKKSWLYASNVNTAFYMHVFNFFVKIIAFCIKNAFKKDNLIFFAKLVTV